MNNIQTIIDPPFGWKYGFPKVIPKQVIENGTVKEWLIKEGYPKEEINGDSFYCRYWTKNIK